MPLAPASANRRRLHTRDIRYEGWLRDDGLFEIEASLTDVKDHDYPLSSGMRRAGAPLHEMHVRLAFDRRFHVTAIEVSIDGMPYPGGCDRIAPEYASLVGANLMHDFRKVLFKLAGGVRGCTHVTELIAFLPTAAMQTVAGLTRDVEPHDERPFQLGRCHALDTTTETVRRYYPKWYRGAA
jgi:hypothetical protein